MTCVNFTNSVFDRCAWSFAQGYYPYVQSPYPLSLQLHNNLFSHTSLTLYHYSGSYGTWEIYDNLFDGATVGLTEESGNPSYYLTTFGYNGFIGTVNALVAATDKRNLTRDFVSGPLGPYYYPTTGGTGSLATLVNADTSRTPASLGLYHDTTTMDQAKEAGSALDIGFHYVAATPAESEIAKAGITATASSTAYGWVPSYGVDSLTSDPGWHNASYTENPAYLRIDLGSSQTVDRVGYVPRVMSTNWLDGSWNGVFRKFNVYVTDDASGNAANWSAPVASGEWFWPNRQERKDVSFAPAVGRYVILQRVTAWGWYGPQDPNWANYGYPPGYASADELWVYRNQGDMVQALDSDADGIADYEEDANGNGVLDVGETDPLSPFFLQDNRFDGEVEAGPVEAFSCYYKCDVTRDITNVPRNGDYPDATFSMLWGPNTPSDMHQAGDYADCRVPPPDPQPTDLMLAGCDYSWPPSGTGYSITWTVLRNAPGNHTTNYNVPRPPSIVVPIPQERCRLINGGGAFVYPFMNNSEPFFSGTYSRRTETTVRLDTGGRQWPKPLRSVVITASATDKTGGASIDPTTGGYQLPEPDNREVGVSLNPATTPMYITYKRLNADGSAMIRAPRGTKYTDVTLDIPNCDWYQFHVSAADPHIVRMTWSRHPLLGQAADIQKLFDDGAMLLAKDDDALIRDEDPRVTIGDLQFDGALYDSDDVPLYVEFIALPAPNPTFPQNYAAVNWTTTQYNDIRDITRLDQLLNAQFANVKQVNSIGLQDEYNNWYWPAGVTTTNMAPTMVIIAEATTPVPIHEWGHTVGLPDNTHDTDRVMYQYELIGTHNTINREELTTIVWSVWSGTPWGW